MKQRIDLTKYKLDRDLPDSYWNNYMQKYDDKYRLFRDGDGIWHIKCSKGKIAMWSILKGQAFFTTNSLTPKQKTYFLKRLVNNGTKDFEVTQEGDYEFIVKFNERLLDSYANLLGICKRMKLSVVERQRRSDLMKNLRKKVNNND